MLGDDADVDKLEVVDTPNGPELRYFEHRFPIAPGTGPGSISVGGPAPSGTDTPRDVHERQHYELVGYRRADTEQNYRRFFAVTTLAGLRIEDRSVYEATHAEIIRWVREDRIDGLRVDHPDGLVDPLGYFRRLRDLGGEDFWLLVEKILEHGEQLPADWPVDGTTGYDSLAEACGIFLDPAAEAPLDALYRELTGDQLSSADHIRAGKRQVVDTILRAEINRLARLVPDIAQADAALAELVVAFPVYRSYLPTGVADLDAALATARAARPDLAATFDALAPRLHDANDELASRFQQTSGAVMAKGVEDTAFYRYTRFVALNEVGGDPAQFGLSPAQFHNAEQHRQRRYPRGMTALSTHDTKRGEDVRARLAVLSELPSEWAQLVRSLMTKAPIPDASFGYLLWQTFAGAGLIERERMHAYAEKAMREAATSTRWTDPDEAFEATVHAAVDAAYDAPAIHDPLAEFVTRITPYGWSNALGQKLVQLTMPGVPDVYQGTEVWENSLVDPDNRRPVDFAAVSAALQAHGAPPAVDVSGAAKLWLVSRTLRLRRDRPDLFTGYTPMSARGPAAAHVLAFDRGGAITVATRLPVTLERDGGWRDTTLSLGVGSVTDVLSTAARSGEVLISDLLDTYPVALLVR